MKEPPCIDELFLSMFAFWKTWRFQHIRKPPIDILNK